MECGSNEKRRFVSTYDQVGGGHPAHRDPVVDVIVNLDSSMVVHKKETVQVHEHVNDYAKPLRSEPSEAFIADRTFCRTDFPAYFHPNDRKSQDLRHPGGKVPARSSQERRVDAVR
jgi:hypothetical protein